MSLAACAVSPLFIAGIRHKNTAREFQLSSYWQAEAASGKNNRPWEK
jgi:hypothetical protein